MLKNGKINLMTKRDLQAVYHENGLDAFLLSGKIPLTGLTVPAQAIYLRHRQHD
jgi:hypothetical protein